MRWMESRHAHVKQSLDFLACHKTRRAKGSSFTRLPRPILATVIRKIEHAVLAGPTPNYN
jgi:hypothetical protein